MRLFTQKSHELGVVELNGRPPQRACRIQFAQGFVEWRCELKDEPRQSPHRYGCIPDGFADCRNPLGPVRIPVAAKVKSLEVRKLGLAVHQFRKHLSSIREIGPVVTYTLTSGVRDARDGLVGLHESLRKPAVAGFGPEEIAEARFSASTAAAVNLETIPLGSERNRLSATVQNVGSPKTPWS